jgi:hypothetical protein
MIDLWLVRAEAVRNGSVMCFQEVVSSLMLREGPDWIGSYLEDATHRKFRRHFSIEPDAVYWELSEHIEMTVEDDDD